MKKFFVLCLGILFLAISCRKVPKNNSIYTETISYNDDGSSYQRKWYLDSDKKTNVIEAVHVEDDTSKITGKRSYWLFIASPPDNQNKNMAAYIDDNEPGVLNGKYTLRRLYAYTGEKYHKNNQLNFKGAFTETIVYYTPSDSTGLSNDTTVRTGTFVLEYEGMNKNQ